MLRLSTAVTDLNCFTTFFRVTLANWHPFLQNKDLMLAFRRSQFEIPKPECRISNKEFRMMKLNHFGVSLGVRYSLFDILRFVFNIYTARGEATS